MTDNCTDSGTETNPYPGDCEFTSFLLQKAAERKKREMNKKISEDLMCRAKKIKLLLLDVDGILTDGSITYTQSGDEIKSFHCRDGFGMNILQKAGVHIGLITARKSEAVSRRAKDLGLAHVFQGARNKVSVFRQIIAEEGIEPSEVAFMGDDWLDLPLLVKVGLSATVADGDSELKSRVHFVTDNPGGSGAVREVCDLIIEAQGMRQKLLDEYLERQ